MKNNIVLLSFLLIVLCSCAASIDPYVSPSQTKLMETSESAEMNTSSAAGSNLAIANFSDRRTVATDNIEEQSSQRIEATGELDKLIRNTLSNNLQKRGITINPNSSVSLRGEIRDWTSHVSASTTGNLKSTAELYVELVGANGEVLYTGTYKGQRSSEFPIIGHSDVQDSLGIAMGGAIVELLKDDKFMQSLRGASL